MAIKTLLLLTFVVFIEALSFGPPEAPDKYSVNDEKVNYFQANLACKRRGQELVSVETPEEWQTIVSLLTDLGYGEKDGNLLWTSAYSLQEPLSQKFYWMSDGSLLPNDAIYWHYGQPDSDGDEECVTIENYQYLSLNDCSCYQNTGYMCESV